MLLTPDVQHDSPLLLIEGGLTAIAIAAAYAWPRIGGDWARRIEQAFGSLARRQGLAVLSVGLMALLLRLAILPLYPIPQPFAPDDFSNLLAADTFAHGRLTNPTPAMWTHFETIHVDMQPTYMSMYFPMQGLFMAAGKVLFGSPWFGILLASALFCAALCWMLQAWLPPGWALLGGILAVLRLSLFSYWINTYTGAGFITGLGGALVLGALPRLMKSGGRQRYAVLLALGAALLALTRPYEGLLLCLPCAVALGHWMLRGSNRPAPAAFLRRAVLPVAIIVVALGWFGYYNYRAFGKPTTLPYTVNRATYAMAPYFVWQQARPEPHYRHASLRKFYDESELKAFTKTHTWSSFVPTLIMKAMISLRFFAGIALLAPLLMIRRALIDRRIRFLIVCLLVLIAGMMIEIFLIPHYLAPFTAIFYAIGLNAMRHLRVWQPEGRAYGLALVRFTVLICFVMAGLRLFTVPLGLQVGEWPAAKWSGMWYGPEHFGEERAQIQARLQQMPGSQLVLVRYGDEHNPLDEWVYNSCDIDSSKVVWAREMNDADNRELTSYYAGRKVWLAEPDAMPARVSPYPIAATPAQNAR
jgi:hypothetical protein